MMHTTENKLLLAAKPVFLAGLEDRLNVQAGFRKDFDLEALPQTAVLHITARSVYRLYVNGELVMHGPARTAHGHLRVDVLDVLPYLHCGINKIAVETSASVGCLGGYSNDQTCESSMLLAELRLNGAVALATDESWDAVRLKQREEYSPRISHCRQNSEIYHLDAAYTAWRTGDAQSVPQLAWQKASLCAASMPTLLPRRMAFPTLEKHTGARLTLTRGCRIDRSKAIPPLWFERLYADYYGKLAEHPMHDYVQTVDAPLTAHAQRVPGGVAFVQTVSGEDPCAVFDFGRPLFGFIGFTAVCEKPCLLDVIHQEFIKEYDSKPAMIDGANPVMRLYLPAGRTSFLAMEPTMARHLKFIFRAQEDAPVGDCSVQDIHVREFCYPESDSGHFHCSDEDVNRLYEAARLTLQLNTLDIFMDCPERERGGWLCDSLWTARAAALLWGDLSVEKAFLENFLLAPYGDGVGAANNFFPEVYPASKLPGAPAITTWSFWLMLELAEYVERSGDLELALTHQKRVEDFVAGSARYIGESGLLQDMPFVFIDWSQSNHPQNTLPISTAANALYAYMLIRLGQLYHRPEWAAEGTRIRATVRSAMAVNDGSDFLDKPFFPDTLRWEDGRLKMGDRYSEACQYTALWAELYEKEEIPVVARAVVRAMGPAPLTPPSTQIGASGLFIGLCIRMDLLAKWGEYDNLLRELKALYLPQLTEGPGTLWETRELNNSSRCHGFASHTAVHLLRDLLGLDIPKVFDLDTRTAIPVQQQKEVLQKQPHLCGLRWMRGAVTTQDGIVSREVSDR